MQSELWRPQLPVTAAHDGFFLGFGGDLMLFKHFGAGFNDVDGIAPINTKRVSLRLQGGIGGALRQQFRAGGDALGRL
jgi:hypothetical protein